MKGLVVLRSSLISKLFQWATSTQNLRRTYVWELLSSAPCWENAMATRLGLPISFQYVSTWKPRLFSPLLVRLGVISSGLRVCLVWAYMTSDIVNNSFHAMESITVGIYLLSVFFLIIDQIILPCLSFSHLLYIWLQKNLTNLPRNADDYTMICWSRDRKYVTVSICLTGQDLNMIRFSIPIVSISISISSISTFD
jgi:hypothetical protein